MSESDSDGDACWSPINSSLLETISRDVLIATDRVGERGCVANVHQRGIDVQIVLQFVLPREMPRLASTVWDLSSERGPVELVVEVDESGKLDIVRISNAGDRVDEQLLSIARAYVKKKPIDADLWSGLIRHMHQRSAELHKYCTVCGCAHPVDGPLMPVPTVCTRPLCVYTWQSYAKFRKAGGLGMAHTAELLRTFFVTAAIGGRNVMNPFPLVVSADGSPFELTKEIIRDVAMTMTEEGKSCCTSVCARCGLDTWAVTSNRSFLMPLNKESRYEPFNTDNQHLIVANPPELEAAFMAEREKYGSKFYFHGSPTENWHNILRNGFYVAEAHQRLNGAVHGVGVYVAPNIHTAWGYSRVLANKSDAVPKNHRMRVIAVCEVAMSPLVKNCDWCLVIPEAKLVVPRFVLAWSEQSRGPQDTNADLEAWCRERILAGF